MHWWPMVPLTKGRESLSNHYVIMNWLENKTVDIASWLIPNLFIMEILKQSNNNFICHIKTECNRWIETYANNNSKQWTEKE